MKITTLILTATLLLVIKSNSQQLVLDTAYGDQGTYTRDPYSEFTDVISIQLQKDNKVLMATTTYDVYNEESIIERINTDGTSDNTFGSNGVQHIDYGNMEDFALQPDGKILTVTYIHSEDNYNLYLRRILANGLPDKSFGENGSILVKYSYYNIYFGGLLLKTDGKIVVSYYIPHLNRNVIRQYIAEGKRDLSFGTNGSVETTDPLGNVRDLLLLPDDKFMAVGQYFSAALNSNSNNMVMYNANGTVDSSIGIKGVVLLNNRVEDNYANTVSTKYFNSKILIYSEDNSNNVLYRFNSQLQSDNDFGINGKVVGTSFSYQYVTRHVDVQPNGRIIVNRAVSNELNRYFWNGTLDTTFGTNSIFSVPAGGLAFTVDKDRLFTAGSSYTGVIGDIILGFVYKPLHNGAKSDNNTLLNKNHFTFYPNPAKNILNIQVNGVAKFTLTNQAGRMFITKAIENYGTLDLSNIPGGIYFLNNILTGERKSVIVIK